jgi:diguanylate cyclase (GGDEF)-like protein
LADLDHFKRINDDFGHQTGDAVLSETARRMAAILRPYDSIGRYGGEEFLIVAPNCTSENIAELAERIRESIANQGIITKTNPVAVTLSLGVASQEDFATPVTLESLLQEADKALYRAKREGRNRVAVTAELSCENIGGTADLFTRRAGK